MKNYVISLVESKNSHTGSIRVRPKERLVLLKCIINFLLAPNLSQPSAYGSVPGHHGEFIRDRVTQNELTTAKRRSLRTMKVDANFLSISHTRINQF